MDQEHQRRAKESDTPLTPASGPLRNPGGPTPSQGVADFGIGSMINSTGYMSAVGSQSVSKCGMPDDAFSRRANHASIPTLDVCTGRLQWRTALHGRGHHKIEHTLEASLLQMRPRRLGGHDLSPGRLPAH